MCFAMSLLEKNTWRLATSFYHLTFLFLLFPLLELNYYYYYYYYYYYCYYWIDSFLLFFTWLIAKKTEADNRWKQLVVWGSLVYFAIFVRFSVVLLSPPAHFSLANRNFDSVLFTNSEEFDLLISIFLFLFLSFSSSFSLLIKTNKFNTTSWLQTNTFPSPVLIRNHCHSPLFIVALCRPHFFFLFLFFFDYSYNFSYFFVFFFFCNLAILLRWYSTHGVNTDTKANSLL